MDKKTIESTVEKIQSTAKKRNFDESIELIVALKNINLKSREQRVDYSINLPHPYRKEVSSLIFIKDKNLASELKGIVDKIVTEDEISKLGKKEAKKLANQYDVFLAEGPAMLTVGKYLGQILSPRGKMPAIAPPNANAIKALITAAISKQVISNKKTKTSVAIQTKIGKRSQSASDVADNIMMVYNSLIDKLPAGKQNFKAFYLKTTMSSTFKVGDE